MHRDLHTLKLVLPDRPRYSLSVSQRGEIRAYTWPCGCTANGHDEHALAVQCCGFHVDLLAAAVSSRGASSFDPKSE